MVQNATEGREDISSVSAEQGCAHTELTWCIARITAFSRTKPKDKTHALTHVQTEFPETSLKN